MKPLVICAIALCTVPPLQAQELYKWVDEDGKVNYSSTPPPGNASKREVIEDRISVVPADPDLERQSEALREREARRAKQAEAEYKLRQQQAEAQPTYVPATTEYQYSDDWWYGGGYDYYAPPVRPPRPAHPITRPRPKAPVSAGSATQVRGTTPALQR